LPATALAQAEKRIALLIGNKDDKPGVGAQAGGQPGDRDMMYARGPSSGVGCSSTREGRQR